MVVKVLQFSLVALLHVFLLGLGHWLEWETTALDVVSSN